MPRVPALSDLEDGLARARATAADTAVELEALVELAARLVRDPHRRGELAREGEALAEKLGDDAARLRCRAMVAEADSRHGTPADVLPTALVTLAEAERLGDPLAVAQAHHTIGRCYFNQDCAPEALEHAHKALDGYRRGGDVFGEGRMLSLMAALFRRLGEPSRSEQLFKQAHDIFLDCDDPSGAGVMLGNAADMQFGNGDPAASAATCEQALERFEQAGMPLDSVLVMTSYATALAELGERDLAALWAKRALERNRLPDGTLANPNYELGLLVTLATTVQMKQGEWDAARATLERTVALADELNSPRWAARAETLLAEVLHASGDPAAAYQHLRRSCRLTEEVTKATQDQRVHALRVRFEVEQAELEALRYRTQAQAQTEIIAELERTKAELASRMDELQRLNDEIIQLSQTDPLTGIANRRRMNDTLADLTEAGARFSTPLSVAVFDIDHFKAINDRYGHDVGDDVLVAFAGLLRAHLHATDLPARLGGDEFVAIMPGSTADESMVVCRRILKAVRGYPWQEAAADLVVTVTIGIADGTGQHDPDEVLRHADAALYRGKNAGRDTVIV
jgi:diguanylate cyclase (GGDEF)-like protein